MSLPIPNIQPPWSREAEQSVIGGLMINNEAWPDIAELLTETDFHLREHQILFQAIQNLAEANQPLDPVTLGEFLQQRNQLDAIGGGDYLGILFHNTPSAFNIIAYAEIVRDRAILRQLAQVGSEIASRTFQPDGATPAQLLDEAEQKIFQIADSAGKHSGAGFPKFSDILVRTLNRIDELSKLDSPITGLATGFTDLDQETAGLQRSDLIIIAGRPSMGKTGLAMNIATNVLFREKLPVAVFSLEMSAEQLSMRLISSVAGVNLQKVRTGKLTDDEWTQVTPAITKLEQSLLFVDEQRSCTPNDIRAKVRRLKREQGQLGLVVIDYLQLMQTSGKENRVGEITEITRSLKLLAGELNVPIIALSQLNRSLENRQNKRPQMSDLRESGSIEQDADLIIFVYRDEVYNEASPDAGTAEIIIAKQRNGPVGMVRLTFRGEFTRFETNDTFYEETL